MKAVIYARFSSDRQREESIEGQLRECHEYARSNGITVINEYIDRALSASKETEKRLDFLRMIRDSGKGLFDIVLVWKLDRFARNRYDSAHYKAMLKKNGVIVQEIFRRYAEGDTIKEIRDDLNARGIRTKKGQPFRYSSFSALLYNYTQGQDRAQGREVPASRHPVDNARTKRYTANKNRNMDGCAIGTASF